MIDSGGSGACKAVASSRASKNSGNAWEPDADQLALYRDFLSGEFQRNDLREKYNLSYTRVCDVIDKTNKWLSRRYMDDIRNLKAEAAGRFMDLYHRAIQEWEQSKKPEVTITTGVHGDKEIDKSSTKSKSGDPRFLAEARSNIAEVLKVWGGYEPIDVRLTSSARVAGIDRDEAIQNRIALLQQQLPQDSA